MNDLKIIELFEIPSGIERLRFLHKLLGGKCVKCFRTAKEMQLNIHHLTYSNGFDRDWTKHYKSVPFYWFIKIYVSEVQRDCILLCRKHHAHVHGRRYVKQRRRGKRKNPYSTKKLRYNKNIVHLGKKHVS